MTRSGTKVRAPGRGRLLEVVDVGVSFGGGVRALNGVSIAVREGQSVGIIGPNGAGKTTLFNVISGFVRPDTGRVRFAGRRVTSWNATQRARAGIGRTFQNVGLVKSATVDENLRTAQDASTLRNELARYLWPDQSSLGARRRHREELVELFDLQEVVDVPVSHLPVGLAKIIELACTLARSPRLLMLDEPSSGLSSGETARLCQTLRDVHRRGDVTMLMIEHDMSLASSLCEYLFVLDFGVLLAEGPPDVVLNDQKVVEAYLGKDVA